MVRIQRQTSTIDRFSSVTGVQVHSMLYAENTGLRGIRFEPHVRRIGGRANHSIVPSIGVFRKLQAVLQVSAAWSEDFKKKMQV